MDNYYVTKISLHYVALPIKTIQLCSCRFAGHNNCSFRLTRFIVPSCSSKVKAKNEKIMRQGFISSSHYRSPALLPEKQLRLRISPIRNSTARFPPRKPFEAVRMEEVACRKQKRFPEDLSKGYPLTVKYSQFPSERTEPGKLVLAWFWSYLAFFSSVGASRNILAGSICGIMGKYWFK